MNKVGIIVLNWNNFDDTNLCLKHIERLDYSPLDVVVVDGGSTDNSSKKLQNLFPKRNFIYLKDDLGYSGGINAGIKFMLHRGVRYFLLLNNDVFMEPDSLEILIRHLNQLDSAGVVGPKIHSWDNSLMWQVEGGYVDIWKSKPIPRWERESNHKILLDPLLVKKVPGCCMVTKREVIEKVGPMDMRFFLYYADTDWQKRVSDMGWKQYIIPQASAFHKVSSSVGKQSPKMTYYDTRDFFYYVQKHYGRKALSYSLIRSLINKRRDFLSPKGKYIIRAYFDFLTQKTGRADI